MRLYHAAAAFFSLLCVSAHYHAKEEEAHDTAVQELEAALLSGAEVEGVLTELAALVKKHDHDAGRVFAAYNRFHDTKKSGGEQALGNQEMRALLKDLGVGNIALRGALAEMATKLLDSGGDGRVSEGELRAAVDIIGCWLGEVGTDVLGPMRRLKAAVDAALAVESPPPLEALAAVADGEAQRCGTVIGAWWASGWLARLEALERAASPVEHELSNDNRWVCATRLPDRVLSHASKGAPRAADGGPQAGALEVRTALKLAGVESLLARHALAKLFVHSLDSDGDHKLTGPEMAGPAGHACDIYAAVRGRGTTMSAVARALSMPVPTGFPPRRFLAALAEVTADGAARAGLAADTLVAARRAAAASAPQLAERANVPQLVALLEAYVRLAPLTALGGAAASVSAMDKAEL